MRYLDKVKFIKTSPGGYDPVLGEDKPVTEVETVLDANVTDLGTDRAQALFGDYKKKRKVIRLLRPYKEPWDYLYYKDVKYQFASHTDLGGKQTLIVGEVKQ